MIFTRSGCGIFAKAFTTSKYVLHCPVRAVPHHNTRLHDLHFCGCTPGDPSFLSPVGGDPVLLIGWDRDGLTFCD